MVEASLQTKQISLEDYMRLYQSEGPFEWIDGEMLALMPTLAGHGTVIMQLLKALLFFLEGKSLGEVITETPFASVDQQNWLKGARVPDVMFYAAERLASYRTINSDWRDKPYLIPPDLAVEVVSKFDKFTEIDEKVAGYLKDGVQLVWVVDPRRRIVVIYHDQQQIRLTEQDTLSGGAVLPEFTLSVKSLFE